MSSKRNVDMSATETTVKIVEVDAPTTTAETKDGAVAEATPVAKVVKKKAKVRGKKYQAVRSQVDKTKMYDAREAVEMVKKLSYTKFDGTIEASIVVKDIGTSVKLTLPHAAGKTKKVAIMSDELLKEIEEGKIDFDILISSPEFMPKLAKHARVLGPKGLMPNPKTGTLTPNPELKKKEFEAGSFTLKTEKKAPLMNLPIGKVSMETDALVENIQAVLKMLTDKVVKMSISASMSPGVKVKVE